MKVNKFIIGDVVKYKNKQLRIQWINHNKQEAGCIVNESTSGNLIGETIPLDKLELVKSSLHTQRPLKPISKMTEDELREHVRLLREGRHEEIVNGYHMRKRKSKKKKPSGKLDKLKKKYGVPDKVAKQMLKHGEKDVCLLMGIEYKKGG